MASSTSVGASTSADATGSGGAATPTGSGGTAAATSTSFGTASIGVTSVGDVGSTIPPGVVPPMDATGILQALATLIRQQPVGEMRSTKALQYVVRKLGRFDGREVSHYLREYRGELVLAKVSDTETVANFEVVVEPELRDRVREIACRFIVVLGGWELFEHAMKKEFLDEDTERITRRTFLIGATEGGISFEWARVQEAVSILTRQRRAMGHYAVHDVQQRYGLPHGAQPLPVATGPIPQKYGFAPASVPFLVPVVPVQMPVAQMPPPMVTSGSCSCGSTYGCSTTTTAAAPPTRARSTSSYLLSQIVSPKADQKQ
ncbi:hypothetical protein R1sor_024066 [Riccia sorocarpa]|uniref:Uncharacterized protein n=1 Tax=Riccia sorocarpa TaxID=122646 RepID=A0ABD3GSM1_9MARC